MKKLAVLLIVLGSGCIAYGISGFSGSFDTDTRDEFVGGHAKLSGSMGWNPDDRGEMVFGAVFLASGLLLLKNSN